MKKGISCALVTVIIGREFSLDKLLDYFQNLRVPDEFEYLNLYFILGCDEEFKIFLKNKIKEFNLGNKFKEITLIEGNRRCHPNLNWEDWEYYTRKKDKLVKHDSALQNIDLGLSSIKQEDFIHLIDDDTIPPYHALDHLYKTHTKVDRCGIASGIYFNKEWLGPTSITEADELKRRIVGSIRKDKWLETSIDDLIVNDHTDIGFVGNGCMLISLQDTKHILPLTENREHFETGAPPDSKICHRIRKLDKKISVVPSVICKHLDDKGNEVGLSTDYLNNIRNSGKPKKVLFSNYNPYLDYSRFLNQFDYIVVTVFDELKNNSYKNKLQQLGSFKNIHIVEKNIKDIVVHYREEKKIEHNLSVLLTLQEIYSFIKDKSEYKAFVYRSKENNIAALDMIDSSKLRDFLNIKI